MSMSASSVSMGLGSSTSEWSEAESSTVSGLVEGTESAICSIVRRALGNGREGVRKSKDMIGKLDHPNIGKGVQASQRNVVRLGQMQTEGKKRERLRRPKVNSRQK